MCFTPALGRNSTCKQVLFLQLIILNMDTQLCCCVSGSMTIWCQIPLLVLGGDRVWLRAGSGGVILNSCVEMMCVCVCVLHGCTLHQCVLEVVQCGVVLLLPWRPVCWGLLSNCSLLSVSLQLSPNSFTCWSWLISKLISLFISSIYSNLVNAFPYTSTLPFKPCF